MAAAAALRGCLTVLLLQASYAPLRLTEYAKPKNIERAREVSFVRHGSVLPRSFGQTSALASRHRTRSDREARRHALRRTNHLLS